MQKASLQDRRLSKTSTPGIYKRGARYVVIVRDPNGRQRKHAARTLAEARELKATLTADVRRGEYRELSRQTFAEYAATECDEGGLLGGTLSVSAKNDRKGGPFVCCTPVWI
jgi:hypothetical protein